MLTEDQAKSVMKERGYEFLSYMQRGSEENKTLTFIKRFGGELRLTANVKLNSNTISLYFTDLQYFCQLSAQGIVFDHKDFEKYEQIMVIYAGKCLDVDVFSLLDGLKKVNVLDLKKELNPEEDIAVRKRRLWDKIVVVGKAQKYSKELCMEFYSYWTEKNDKGKRMRFEMEKVFEVKLRLATWIRHDKKWSKTFIDKKAEKQNEDVTKTTKINTEEMF